MKKLQELGITVMTVFLALGFVHVGWTIFCGVFGLDRGY